MWNSSPRTTQGSWGSSTGVGSGSGSTTGMGTSSTTGFSTWGAGAGFFTPTGAGTAATGAAALGFSSTTVGGICFVSTATPAWTGFSSTTVRCTTGREIKEEAAGAAFFSCTVGVSNGVTRRKGLGVVWGLETTAAGGGVVVVLGWATVEVSMSWRLVWLGVTVSWRGSTDFTTAWGRLWSPFKAASTPWYTVENTCCSFWNFTSVFVGWTFTSTVLGRTVRWSTQPGNLPTIFWLR